MLDIRKRSRSLYQRKKHRRCGILGLGSAAQEGIAQPVHRPNMATIDSFNVGFRNHGFSFPFP